MKSLHSFKLITDLKYLVNIRKASQRIKNEPQALRVKTNTNLAADEEKETKKLNPLNSLINNKV